MTSVRRFVSRSTFANRFPKTSGFHSDATPIGGHHQRFLANGLGPQCPDNCSSILAGRYGEHQSTTKRQDFSETPFKHYLSFHSQSFPQFWPDDSLPIESDHYRVKFVSKTNKNDYVGRDFVMQSIQDDYELNVRMLHCPSWPEMANPSSIYDFIVDVHHRGNEYRNGPIVVVDRYVLWMVCLGYTKAKKLH